MEHKFGAELNHLILRPVMEDDLELLRQWRNSATISKYLRKIEYITSERQIVWYRDLLLNPDSYYWTITEKGKAIGALSIYNIADNVAEIGRIMIGDVSSQGKGYGYKSLIMAMKIGFLLLQVKSYNLTVHKENNVALHIYQKTGFHERFQINNENHENNENNKDVELKMIINRQTYEEKNMMSNDIIVYSDIFNLIVPPPTSPKFYGDNLTATFKVFYEILKVA